ncbi:Scr1 family TA system antitoxin-like transcriptional regulator [Dactylosporangium sp. NPDC000555]|uniref:Scr1 family TA system antitoxin-like transcriptional regulator n=1 Tax=Dactylosporangium sp. NPDC000555 TaxID=3154260 RepID=UPI00332FDF91
MQQARQRLADRLREIRLGADLTGVRLAELAGWHRTKVSKIEHATTAPSADDIRTWCLHCNQPDLVPDLVATLHAVEGMFIEWRRLERTGLRAVQDTMTPLWERTRTFRIYSSFVVPGPLQTRAYTAAVLTALAARRRLPNDVDAATQVREDRQRFIHEGAHRFAIVLEESVLRNAIGGVETMSGQLGQLLAVSSLPSVSLSIIPQRADRSAAWPIESFWIYDDRQVGVELVSGYLTITQPTEVGMYATVFAEQAAVAVRGAAARALIIEALAALDKPAEHTRAHPLNRPLP